LIGIKWTGRREDGTTLDRDTIRAEVVKPLRADDDEGTVLGVLPSPPELNNERNTGDSENQDTGGDNPEGGRGDAEDGGTDARSGSTLARSVLTIRSN